MKVILSALATVTILLISPIICEISNGESIELRRIGHDATIITTANNSSSNAFDTSKSINLRIDHSFDNHNTNFSNLVRIGDTLNVFRIESIGAAWTSFRSRVNRNCSNDLFAYIKGLEDGKPWAVKSEFFLMIY